MVNVIVLNNGRQTVRRSAVAPALKGVGFVLSFARLSAREQGERKGGDDEYAYDHRRNNRTAPARGVGDFFIGKRRGFYQRIIVVCSRNIAERTLAKHVRIARRAAVIRTVKRRLHGYVVYGGAGRPRAAVKM